MSQWNDRIRNHPVWSALQNLGPIIDQGFSRAGNDASAVESLARLKSILIFIGRRLAGADQLLLTVSPLDGLNSALAAHTSEIQQYISNGATGHLVNANSHADTALTHISQLNTPNTTEDFQGAKEAAESYRQRVEQALAELNANAAQVKVDQDNVRARLTELATEISSEKSRLSALGGEFQSQFSSAQELRSQEYSAAQKDRQETYAKTSAEYVVKFAEQTAEMSQRRAELTQQHVKDLEDLRNKFVGESNAIRDEMQARKVEVEELLGVIGSIGVSSGYQKIATEAKYTTWLWQAVTVLSLLGLVTIAVKVFMPVVQGEFTWTGFAGRVFVSVTVGLLAGYAATQADRYQKLERSNRQAAIEFQAIGPFIAPLQPDKRDEFRLKIGDRSFGQRFPEVTSGDIKSPVTILDLLHSKDFRSFVADIVKAAKG